MLNLQLFIKTKLFDLCVSGIIIHDAKELNANCRCAAEPILSDERCDASPNVRGLDVNAAYVPNTSSSGRAYTITD